MHSSNMKTKPALFVWASALALSTLLFTAGRLEASHRWYCWKYANSSINFYNGAVNGTKAYRDAFTQEAQTDSNSWHNGTEINLTSVGSAGTTDHCNCYSGSYGFNGWLGIAEIRSYSGCTVREGRARLNASYLNSGSYGQTNDKHVACQEVGHLWGLNHNRSSTTTCMNDTILYAPQINSHDISMVNSIY